jgi:ribose transport system permease protein
MAQQVPAGSDTRNQMLRWSSRHARMLAPFMTLIAMFIFFSLVTDVFLTTRNLQNVVTQIGPVAVAAVGVTFVLLCAEIDLSIASTATFSGVLAAYFWVTQWNVDIFGHHFHIDLGTWGIIVGAVAGAVIGLLNGFFTAYIGLPSFMMTLAMLTIAHGMSVFVTQGKPIFKVPSLLEDLGGAGNRFLGVPVIGLFALGILIIGDIILSYTKFGRYVFMTGGNREAAEMSGINTRMVTMMCLTICGFTAGLAGMLFIGRLHSANPSAGGELLIGTVAAVVLGGTSLFGGEGGIKNTILGVVIFGVLSNGLNLIEGLSIYFKEALQGIILVGALLLNVLALRLERVQTRTE